MAKFEFDVIAVVEAENEREALSLLWEQLNSLDDNSDLLFDIMDDVTVIDGGA